MSIAHEHLMEEQETQAHVEEIGTSPRSLFARETGQVLVTLGTVFKFIPPFNDHIDQNTGQLLISIGKKLKSTK